MIFDLTCLDLLTVYECQLETQFGSLPEFGLSHWAIYAKKIWLAPKNDEELTLLQQGRSLNKRSRQRLNNPVFFNTESFLYKVCKFCHKKSQPVKEVWIPVLN